VSVVVSLYLFEGYLTFKEQHTKDLLDLLTKKKLYEKETGKKYDTRTKGEIYEDLKKINNKIKIIVPPGGNYSDNNHKLFPLSGVSNSETIHNNESGYYSIYQSDRYGFNNPDDEWDSKEIEYLLIGDSFVHGNAVNRPNDIGSVLRTLSNKSVLNLGYGGNGTLIEYATLREYLNPNVKKVLWIYFEENDLIELGRELKHKILKNYLNDLTFTQNLKLKQKEINDLSNDRIEIEREKENLKLKLIRFIKILKLRTSNFYQEQTPQKLPISDFKKILKLAKDLTIQNNSRLYFVYLPGYKRYKTKYDDTNYNLIKKIVSKLDIPFIDIRSEVFQKEENPLKLFPFELHGHYTVGGYKKVSETIYKFTKD